ncbi:V-set and immunoglobulin domain-containing protein 1 [Bufo gargarizans]|uniref:V-set and immunoglobulin domain-containing protein 1 n=1 Tax=Bufo gargarizans TaxID=30331 RepID=UPI001CF315A1|nr:V-set and immunoglobulin domain-containing protein 1 [Bufo gargarizans]
MIPPFLRTFVLLGSFIGVVHCVQVTVPKSVVNVTVGQSATLPCTYTLADPNTRNLVVQWDFVEAHSQKTVSVYAYQNGQPYSMGRFQNRVTFSNTTGNATITISNMQPQDTGVYRCEVSNFPDPLGEGQIQLIVQVAPSTPHCSIQGNIVTGHSVKLVCYSEQGMPRPDYIWQRVTNGIVKPIIMAQQNGVLTIGNMSKFEDGYYHCTASNSLGNTTCELDLHTGGAAGVIVGGIIGAVLLATIICVVIWFLVVKKKHKKKQLKSSELKPVSSTTGQSAAEEPARQNLVVSEPPETREYQDVPENVAAGKGEVEDPAV